MQIFIGCAKLMGGDNREIPGCTLPAFGKNADEIALQLSQYSVDELAEILGCNKGIAKENWLRYQHFFYASKRRAALFSYSGMVYQKIDAATMTPADLEYANAHLMIGSFLYGLLRPLDLISPYRLEGKVELPGNGFRSLFDYWKPILTDWFIERVKGDDGVLVNLASNEFRDIFDWKRVKKELTVIAPDFKMEKEGKLKTVVVYAKMCRGAMTRWIIRNRINDAERLKAFEYEGFHWERDNNFILR